MTFECGTEFGKEYREKGRSMEAIPCDPKMKFQYKQFSVLMDFICKCLSNVNVIQNNCVLNIFNRFETKSKTIIKTF